MALGHFTFGEGNDAQMVFMYMVDEPTPRSNQCPHLLERIDDRMIRCVACRVDQRKHL